MNLKNSDLPAEQQFSWTVPGWPMSKMLADWEGQTPERKTLIHKTFNDGRPHIVAANGKFTLDIDHFTPVSLLIRE